MLSDEEKEAIKNLRLNVTNVGFSVYDGTTSLFKMRDIQIVLNLIEKQSKEIEERIRNKFISKDKIKAKIEPRLKELDEQMKKEWKEYGNSREYQDMEDEWNFLQSLLEKE